MTKKDQPALTLEQLKHLKEVCAKATPGPWKFYNLLPGGHEVCVDGDYARGGICVPVKKENALYIATFNPTQVAELLELVEKLKAHCKHHKAFEDAATHEAETLRAEVERIKIYEQMSWETTDITSETVEVPKAEDLVRELAKFRDWQRRALPLIKCWLALSYCDGYFLQDETEMKKVREGYEELIAEAEQTEENGPSS